MDDLGLFKSMPSINGRTSTQVKPSKYFGAHHMANCNNNNDVGYITPLHDVMTDPP